MLSNVDEHAIEQIKRMLRMTNDQELPQGVADIFMEARDMLGLIGGSVDYRTALNLCLLSGMADQIDALSARVDLLERALAEVATAPQPPAQQPLPMQPDGVAPTPIPASAPPIEAIPPTMPDPAPYPETGTPAPLPAAQDAPQLTNGHQVNWDRIEPGTRVSCDYRAKQHGGPRPGKFSSVAPNSENHLIIDLDGLGIRTIAMERTSLEM